jgi:hypothetical protein
MSEFMQIICSIATFTQIMFWRPPWNRFTGSLLASTCEGPYTSIFGCADTVMCRPGTFSPTGAASHFGPCVLCDEDDPFLGQTTCSSREYLVGDIDLDGVLSEREILHLLFTYTHGFEWGSKYNTEWMDLQISACHLPGTDNIVTLVVLSASLHLPSFSSYFRRHCMRKEPSYQHQSYWRCSVLWI